MRQEYRVLGVVILMAGLLLLAVVGVMAQEVTGLIGGDMGYVPGLRKNPITSEQRQQIIGIRQNMHSQIQNIRANQNLSQQEKQAEISEILLNSNTQIVNVLTPEQKQEFAAWWEERQERSAQMTAPRSMGAKPQGRVGAGPGMMQKGNMGFMPGLQQNPLSSDQQQRIAAIRKQEQNQIQSVRMNKNLSMQEKNSRMAEIRSNTHSQVMNVLTSAQREEFMQWWKSR